MKSTNTFNGIRRNGGRGEVKAEKSEVVGRGEERILSGTITYSFIR
jgi:hypothetical protein